MSTDKASVSTSSDGRSALRKPRVIDFLGDERYEIGREGSLKDFLLGGENRSPEQFYALSQLTIRECLEKNLFPWDPDQYPSVFLNAENLIRFQKAIDQYDNTYGSAIRDGKEKARRVRSHWLNMLTSGSVGFAEVVELSKREDNHKYISAITLLDILKGKPGWTENSSLSFLSDAGIGPKDNIRNIRRSPKRVKQFAAILETAPDRWRQRPQLPAGWPWNGKLSDLVVSTGSKFPQELQDQNKEAIVLSVQDASGSNSSPYEDSAQEDLSLGFLD